MGKTGLEDFIRGKMNIDWRTFDSARHFDFFANFPTFSFVQKSQKFGSKILNHTYHCLYSSLGRIRIYNKPKPLLDLEIQFLSTILEIFRLKFLIRNFCSKFSNFPVFFKSGKFSKVWETYFRHVSFKTECFLCCSDNFILITEIRIEGISNKLKYIIRPPIRNKPLWKPTWTSFFTNNYQT